MHRALARMSTQHGLITRRQALESGLSPERLAQLVRTRAWVCVRRGVYATAEAWADWDEHVARPCARARAVHLVTPSPHVLSHDSAAHLHGLAVLRPRSPLVHLTRPELRSSRTRQGVKHHGARFWQTQVETVDGLPVLDPARTAADMAREHGVMGGLPTFDSALRAGVPRSRLEAVVASMRGWPDVAAPRECLDLADPGAENVAESLARHLVEELGLEPATDTQFPVRTPRGVVWCDLRVGCHVFEFDGRIKYLRVDEGGVADRPAAEVIWAEKLRERDIAAAGLGVSRIVWDDFWGASRALAKRRLLAEYAATRDRLGEQLPAHLAEVAAQVRADRGPGGRPVSHP